MKEQHKITCEDCKSEYLTSRINTKYCGFHRFLRDFLYARNSGHEKKCGFCDKRFLPVNVKQRYCFTCMPVPASFGEAECYFCHEIKPKVHKDIAICGPCATKADNDERMHKQLRIKNNWLHQHPVTLDG